jgi:hypothetical protein
MLFWHSVFSSQYETDAISSVLYCKKQGDGLPALAPFRSLSLRGSHDNGCSTCSFFRWSTMAVLHSFNSPVENMNLLLGQLMAISIPFVLGCVFRIRSKNNSMFLYNDLVMVRAFCFALPTVNKLEWVSEVRL